MVLVGVQAVPSTRAAEPGRTLISANRLIVQLVPEHAEFGRAWMEGYCDAKAIWKSRRHPGLTVIQFEPELFEFVDTYLRGVPFVRYVSYDYIGTRHSAKRDEPNHCPHQGVPNDPIYPIQWFVNSTQQSPAIKAPCAWTVITCIDPTYIIAVLDNGADIDPEANPQTDFFDNLWQNVCEIPGNSTDDDLNGYCDDRFGAGFFGELYVSSCAVNTCPGDQSFFTTGAVECGNQHGDMITNIIGGRGNNGKGGTGIAWECRIMTVRVVDDQGLSDSKTLAGIEYALEHGAKILNLSYDLRINWGDPIPDPDPLYEMIAGAADEALFVCSAGNQGVCIDPGVGKPYYRPQAYSLPNLIVVAASTSDDSRWSATNFSPTLVHLAAPGHMIYAPIPPDCEGDQDCGVDSGTSFAAPMVAAVAGFVWTLNPTYTPAQIKSHLLATVRDNANWNTGNTTCGQDQKWVSSGGILDAAAAVGANCDE